MRLRPRVRRRHRRTEVRAGRECSSGGLAGMGRVLLSSDAQEGSSATGGKAQPIGRLYDTVE